ncbi:hypothetical protein PV08_00230 [Exophiala spinifera]|uniref:Isochorismatase-like domain-containing protein n=1 Tax=Exophiala spinifera TaxID=91928 RepID=A0A0D1YWI0_9EURO|nr:uncharacterized protein PV08_00230 [Exophiala spinifera]KIW19656.1 hypothetical protein PV08_00230 [Exophiala spinifera]
MAAAVALDPSRYPGYAAECGDPSRTKKLGFGTRPAILLLDMCDAYFSPSSPLVLDQDTLDRVSKACSEILDTVRARPTTADEVPVIYAQTFYTHPKCRDAGLAMLKSEHVALFQAQHPQNLTSLSKGPAVILPKSNDSILKKKYPSAFFGTNLSTQLAAMSIDTLIIGGLTTSLNVRATALDAMQSGFRPIIVAEACGDRVPELHWANMMDVGAKYGDVVGVEDAVSFIRNV